VPVVMAGGPKCETEKEVFDFVYDGIKERFLRDKPGTEHLAKPASGSRSKSALRDSAQERDIEGSVRDI